jgi:hypothetical protein
MLGAESLLRDFISNIITISFFNNDVVMYSKLEVFLINLVSSLLLYHVNLDLVPMKMKLSPQDVSLVFR